MKVIQQIGQSEARLGHKLFKAGLMACAAATVLSAATGTAWAQAAADGEEEVFKNEILVTAQRRSERLESVPMSVAAVSADNMAAAGVTSVRDISKIVAGVQIGQAGGFTQPSVRGITTLTNNVNFENNVAIYVDGFYEPAPQAINIDLPNVDNIQVLKGPQGTLYGRNATGGAILLNTIDPGDTLKGRVELTYGRFDDKRASAYIAGPLTDKIGFSVAGYTRRSDGYVKFASLTTPGDTFGNAAPNKQDAFRAKLKFQVTDSLSIKLAYNYTRVNDPRFSYFSVYENVPNSLNIPSRPTRPGVVAANYPAMLSSKLQQATMVVKLETGIGDLTSYTGYAWNKLQNRFDFDGSYINGGASTYSSTDNNQKTFQQAVDYSITAIERLNLVVGANYFHDKLTPFDAPFGTSVGWNGPGNNFATAPQERFVGLTPASRQSGEQDKKAWAIYADATYEVVDHLYFNLGGRYSSETQNLLGSTECILPIAQCTTGTLIDGKKYTFVPTARHLKFTQFTPRAGLRYELAARTNIYATYSKGFRPGAITTSLAGLTPATWAPIKSETVDAFEIGYKTAGRNFRFETAAFMYDFKNLQTSATQLLGTPPTATVVLGNAPKAKVKGFEASFEYNVTDNFTVRGGGAYLDAKYGTFTNSGGTGVNPLATGAVLFTDPLKNYLNQSQIQDWTGKQMARAPKFSGNLGVEYNIPNGDGGLKFTSNISYTSSYVPTNPSVWCTPDATRTVNPTCAGIPVDVQGKQRFRQGGYALISASATWTDPKGNFYVQVYGNNLTNEKYAQHYTGTANGTYIPLAEPMTYGGRVGYKF